MEARIRRWVWALPVLSLVFVAVVWWVKRTPPSPPPAAGASAVSPSPSMDDSPAPPPSASAMAATHGFLEVRSSIADAQVFLFDVHLGPVNQRHEVVCKTYFVRTASIDPMRWYTQGRSVAVPCGGTVTIVMEPKGIGPGR